MNSVYDVKISDFDFNSHIAELKFAKDDMRELIALLSYKDEGMINLNMQRALHDIEFIRDAVNNLEKTLMR